MKVHTFKSNIMLNAEGYHDSPSLFLKRPPLSKSVCSRATLLNYVEQYVKRSIS